MQVHVVDGVGHEVGLGSVRVRLSQTVRNGRLAVKKPVRSNYETRCILSVSTL